MTAKLIKYAGCFLLFYLVQSIHASPNDEQKEVAEDIANSLGEGDYDGVREHFDQQLKQTLPATAIEQAWASLIAQTGEFNSVVRTQGGYAQGYDIIDVLCSTNQAGLIVRVVFFPGSSLAHGLFVMPAQSASPQPSRSNQKKTPRFPE
jgi:hypothetical protein